MFSYVKLIQKIKILVITLYRYTENSLKNGARPWYIRGTPFYVSKLKVLLKIGRIDLIFLTS